MKKASVGLVTIACAIGFSLACHAQGGKNVAIGSQETGVTPFIKFVNASFSGGALASVDFVISPKPGSFTRPVTTHYKASSLSTEGFLSGTDVKIPVFGLYAGYSNTVGFVFTFTDGSVVNSSATVNTDVCASPCSLLNAPKLQQHRLATSDLNFDYFLLKDFASPNSPAVLDTDGNVRWVGFSGKPAQPSTFYLNGVYASDGATGIVRMELYGGITKHDFAGPPFDVTSTINHNMDLGRNGIVLEVDTKTQYEANALEFDGRSGNILNEWNMDRIISAAMAAGGDDPSQLVRSPSPGETAANAKGIIGINIPSQADGPVGNAILTQAARQTACPTPGATSGDWFHMNATAYNPSDNTLVVSSRENFVIAVDYDPPADHSPKKIHWILGDTTKKWYNTNSGSLRRFALQLPSGTLPPIGQHGISIESNGDLLLMDDGCGSTVQVPPGITRNYSAVRSYKIDTKSMTATAAFTYSPSGVYSPICGSAYETTPPGSYLINFSDITINNQLSVELQGLGAANKVIFDLTFPEGSPCSAGWNALPIMSYPIQY